MVEFGIDVVVCLNFRRGFKVEICFLNRNTHTRQVFTLFLIIYKYGRQRNVTRFPEDGVRLTAWSLSVLERMVRHFLHL